MAAGFLQAVERTGERARLTTPFGTVSTAELADTALDLAGGLRELPDPAAPFLLVMGGDPWTVAVLIASELAGRPVLLMHPSSTPEQFGMAAEHGGARFIIQYGPASNIHVLQDSSLPLAHGLVCSDLARGRASAREERSGSVPTWFIGHRTSGTMGFARMAVRSGPALTAEVLSLQHILELSEGDIVLCGSSVSHSYGCVGGLLAPLVAGASVCLAPTPDSFSAALGGATATIVFGLGPAYARLPASKIALRTALAGVRYAFSAGAQLETGLFDRLLTRFGLSVRQDYGTSETGTIALDLGEHTEPQSVGTPLPHVDVRLRPLPDIPLEQPEEGDVQVRSPALARGYLVKGELIPCTDAAGWYSTRDAGSWEQGRLRLHRRLRPLPVIDGERVYLDRVERVMQAMPGVIEVVVWPDGTGSRVRLNALVAAPATSVEAVLEWSRERLPPGWVPERVELCERLPRTPAGKIVHQFA